MRDMKIDASNVEGYLARLDELGEPAMARESWVDPGGWVLTVDCR